MEDAHLKFHLSSSDMAVGHGMRLPELTLVGGPPKRSLQSVPTEVSGVSVEP